MYKKYSLCCDIERRKERAVEAEDDSGNVPKITLYENSNFLGRKWTFQNGAKNVQLPVNAHSMSMKVTGKNRWRICDDIGNYLEIGPGNYPNLQENGNSTRLSNVHSIQAVPHIQQSNGVSPAEIPEHPHSRKHEEEWAALGAWFLGSKAENINFFSEMASLAFKGNGDFRKTYYPTDPSYITDSITCTEGYTSEIDNITTHLKAMIQELKNSVPIASIRYQAHMVWDCTMPANLGYLAAFLYNQNNVGNEASPVTTQYEIEVGQQLCKMIDFAFNVKDNPEPWGHITAGGSISNIEALWSSRNVKFYPLAVSKALKSDPVLKKAINYEVSVPGKKTKFKLVDLDTWTLLNLDLDDIIRMPKEIPELLQLPEDDQTTYTETVDFRTLANVGWQQFSKDFKFNQPVVIASRAMHYSLTKATSLLGIGPQNIRGVAFDVNARMDMKELRKILDDCVKKKIPIISIVAAIGTTQESAVDPLSSIVELRNEYRSKGLRPPSYNPENPEYGMGLNFIINADAAWGGYFMSMIHEPEQNCHLSDKPPGYIPAIPLSDYTETQLRSLKHADTVTTDPHKSGFCPYPAGGLCYRNGGMRGFVKVEAEVVYHQGKNPSVGIWGVEGSKQGAAAAGVLLSHRVIGLHKLGYGRILGQCVFGSTLFYCTWLTLAKENDNFVCVPMIPTPSDLTSTQGGYKKYLNEQQAKEFIKTHILGKSDKDLLKDPLSMEFLKQVGPDTLINAFAVNYKSNKDLEKGNALNFEVFRRLSHTTVLRNIKRIPLILTHSKLSAKDHDKTCAHFKYRLGLKQNTVGGLDFLINTVMNPWITYKDQMHIISTAFRQTVLNAIGMLTDTPALHGFVCVGQVNEKGEVFGDHLPMFYVPAQQYHAVAKFQFQQKSDIKTIIKKQQEELKRPIKDRQPLIIGPKDPVVLEQFLYNAMKKPLMMECRIGVPSVFNPAFLTAPVKVLDIPRCNHFDLTVTEYPKFMSYFLFGDDNKAYLSHNMIKYPDFQQIVELDSRPHSVPKELLELGIDVSIMDMKGSPLMINDHIVDPLQLDQYSIEFTSYDDQDIATTISMQKEGCKVWFDSKMLDMKV